MGRIFNEEEREKYKNLIEYPEYFIYKCLTAYSDDEEMEELLREKSFLVISKIQRESNEEITTSDIIEADRNNNMAEIVQRAYKIEMNKELQNEFIKIYDEQYRSKGKFIRDGQVFTRKAKLSLCEYRPPVSVEAVPEYEPSDRLKAALDYKEACEAHGRIAAGNHIAGGGILHEYDGPGGALEKKYKM